MTAEVSCNTSAGFTFILPPKNDYRCRIPLGWASTSFPLVGKRHRMLPRCQCPHSNLQRYWVYTSTFFHQAHRGQAHRQEVLWESCRPPQSFHYRPPLRYSTGAGTGRKLNKSKKTPDQSILAVDQVLFCLYRCFVSR